MISGELVIDSFAGGGGASRGIEIALGRSPDIAINHDAEALAMHAANHPATRHLPANVWKVDPAEVCAGRPVGLLWASPDCKHHSKAKGGKPVSRAIRDLAWVVVRWARQVRPRVILLENVEEFRGWGPVGRDGLPCRERKGQTFELWVADLRRLGYRVEWRELRACDYGAPTIRKRLFVVARRDGRKIVWPEPTHGDPKSEGVRSGKLAPWRAAAEIIDWTLPCHSIFLTREEGRAVGVNRPLADATMARIAKGVKRYVIDAAKPFIVPITHTGSERVNAIDDPLRTITTAHRGEQALVAPFITKFNRGAVGHGLDEPLHTVTAAHSETRPGAAAPLGVVASYLVPRYGERAGQEPRTRSLEAPMPVVVPTANGGSLAAVHLHRQFGASIGAEAAEPVGTVTAGGGGKTAVVAAFLAQHNGGPRPGDTGRAADEPISTVTATGAQQAIVSAFLAQHNTDMVGHDAREPVSTIVGKGCTQAVVSAGLLILKGSDRRASDPEAPTPTICAGGWHVGEVRTFLAKYYGSAIGQAADEPLHTATVKPRFGLVMVGGEPHEIVDIGMRMLSPRELFRAQGFGDDYIIDRGLAPDGKWTALTKTAQVRMCGNSVCPPVAAALVAANYRAGEMVQQLPAAAAAGLFEAVA